MLITIRVVALLALTLSVLSLPPPQAVLAAPPAGFSDDVVTPIGGPTALAFLPDGRMLITQQGGALRVLKNGALLPNAALDLSSVICNDGERGLLGVAVHPQFGTNGFIYLFYTREHPTNGCAKQPSGANAFTTSAFNRVSRFTMGGDIVTPGSELVLIDRVPSFNTNHNGGDLHFGKDGYLYISIGDAGADYRDDGGGGDNDAARQESTLLGKILRVTDNGGIPPSNPFQGADSGRCNTLGRIDPNNTALGRCQETFAWGLRNPFRIAFDPNAAGTRFFINDVGQNVWEEIDEGIAGADYGWNVREGHCANGSKTNCGPPPAGMTNPVYDYEHKVYPGSSTSCNSITGGAFVPSGVWPAAYDGSYLFSDYVCGTIFHLSLGGTNPVSSTFTSGVGGAVAMQFGPYGSTQALYYTTQQGGGRVRRISYTGSINRSPSAAISADRTAGPLPLTVNFNGGDSSDPDSGDTLSYSWNFGDGTAPQTTSSPTISHIYTTFGSYNATLQVRDNRGATSANSASIMISAGDNAPSASIDAPAASSRFRVGQVITLQGSGSDVEDGQPALSWSVKLHHNNDHTHPFLPPTSGVSVTLTAPAPEDLAAARGSYLEVQLTATDSIGNSTIVTRTLLPNMVNITFETEPAGLELLVNNTPVRGGTQVVSWEGFQLNISTVPQKVGEQWLLLDGWSDGAPSIRTIVTPGGAATYRALFEPGQVQLLPLVVK